MIEHKFESIQDEVEFLRAINLLQEHKLERAARELELKRQHINMLERKLTEMGEPVERPHGSGIVVPLRRFG